MKVFMYFMSVQPAMLRLVAVAAFPLISTMAIYWIISSNILKIYQEELEAMYATGDSKFMNADGVRMHYVDQGTGPVVFLLHGSFLSLQSWDSLATDLVKAGYRVIRPDLLTSGLTSEDPNGNYSVGRNVELVNILAEKLGTVKMSIVGTSYGGIIGFNYAAKYPGKVSKLVLINCGGLPRVRKQGGNSQVGALFMWMFKRHMTKGMVQSFFKSSFIKPHSPPKQLIDICHDMRRRIGRNQEAELMIQQFHTGDPESILSKVQAPTFIMWGTDNLTAVHLDADVFEHWLTNAPCMKKKYNGAGHYMFLEIPEKVNKDIKDFLNGNTNDKLRLTQRVLVANWKHV
mmetsp:Transcript_15237/g.22675  ORF Transcript_15237/g.22675 Transcript_15237/m.22675 type:complete len:344 (-) Transcript_15237:75-1106(-)